MYLRMLKRDLSDKVGLNVILFIFMIIAATLIVISSGFIYTFISGIDRSYEKCHTSDFILLIDKSMTDYEGQKKAITDFLRKDPNVDEIIITERPFIRTSHLEFEGVNKKSVTGLYESECMLLPVVKEGQNIPCDLNDESFALKDGCVALPQYIAAHAKAKVGDKFSITTDMGNTYEFRVQFIFKDPATAMINKILLSDSDYKAIESEFPSLVSSYECTLKVPYTNIKELSDWGNDLYNELYRMTEDGTIDGNLILCNTAKTNTVSNESMVSLIIGIFMGLIGIVLILLVFMTIHFSLKSTIKREEKEIGAMKAIGVDSLSYKALFIVKYIAFAIVGGVTGLIAGMPISRYMVNNFIINTINPELGAFLLISLISTTAFVLIMITFSFVALRRMKNISVMDTIHGENRGERFKKLPGMQLYKSRKMSIPFFMASCDISGRIKRYIYLIVSFSLGIVVIFMLLQLKRTIVNENFSKTYWQIADREVFIRPDEGLRDKLIQQEGSYRNVFLYYERFFNENGVPLNIQIADMQNAFMINGDEKEGIDLYFGDFEPDRLTIVKGGRTPEKTNEVAVSHFLQKTKGVQIGDTITIEYMVYSDDGFSRETKTRDFLVTAYIETYGLRSADIFTAGLKEDIVMDSWDLFNEGIDADGAEYDAAIEKMRELMPGAQIWNKDQVLAFDLGDQFGGIIDLLTIVLSIILGITFSAMTLLYEQIFIEEETADIAMMKSMGMDRATIRKWHFERIMILIAIASVIGIIMAFTVSKYALELLGISTLSIVSFSIADPPLLSVVIVPAVLAMLISLVLMVAMKSMDDIQIWRVRNE